MTARTCDGCAAPDAEFSVTTDDGQEVVLCPECHRHMLADEAEQAAEAMVAAWDHAAMVAA